jgi:hypothetical protein
MLKVITCEVSTENRQSNKKEHDTFAFKSNQELNQFLKTQLKKEKEIHLYGSSILTKFSEVNKHLKEMFRVQGTFCFIQRKNDTNVIYSIKEKQYRTLGEKKPSKKIGDSWTLSYRKRKIIITWQSIDSFRLEIKATRGGSTSWHHKSYRAALSTAKKEIDSDIQFNRSYRHRPTKAQREFVPEVEVVEKKPKEVVNFKKGQMVEKQFIFQGEVTDKVLRKVHSVKKGVVYLEDEYGELEWGTTYKQSGKEIEEAFLPHSWTKIVRVEE